jgi:hypothetical protein
MKYALFFTGVLAAIVWGLNVMMRSTSPLTEAEIWLTMLLAVVLFGAAEILRQLEKVQNALDQGNPSQGTHEQGRKPTQEPISVPEAERLIGHWHRSDSDRSPAYEASACCYNSDQLYPFKEKPAAISRECPRRDPRSTR